MIGASVNFRGFYVEGGLAPHVPATYHHPAEGGDCEEFTIIGLADIGRAADALDELGLYEGREWASDAARFVRDFRACPRSALDRLEVEWADEISAALEAAHG